MVSMWVNLWYPYHFSFNCKNRRRVNRTQSQNLGRALPLYLSYTSFQTECARTKPRIEMAGAEIEELVVHLERNLELSTMEQGIKLLGNVMANKTLTKWGVRIILKSSWKEWGEIDIKWVKANTLIVTVQDESTAAKILDQVPWAVMKQNFAVKRWPQELALEEVNMVAISFWIQIRGVPPNLSSKRSVRYLASKIGEVEDMEDPARARGFLRMKVSVDTSKPLITGCWLPREDKNETWIEFQYEGYRISVIDVAELDMQTRSVRLRLSTGAWQGTGNGQKHHQFENSLTLQDPCPLLWGSAGLRGQ